MTEPVFLRDEYTGAVVRDPMGTPIVIGVSNRLVLRDICPASPYCTDATADLASLWLWFAGNASPATAKLYGHSSYVICRHGISSCYPDDGSHPSSSSHSPSSFKLRVPSWLFHGLLCGWISGCRVLVSVRIAPLPFSLLLRHT